IPGLFDRDAGLLTQKGVEAAQAAGLDPRALMGKIGEEFAKIYAKSPDAAAAGAQFSTGRMGIESTLGQRTKDAEQLLQEGAMRRGIQGEAAKQVMTDFDRRQAEQVRAAAIGNSGNPGLATNIAPHRTAEEFNAADLGQGIRAGMLSSRASAKAAERAA